MGHIAITWSLTDDEKARAHELIAEKTVREGDCILWAHKGRDDTYPQVHVLGKYIRAHRLVYMTLVGPIPEGLVLDHLCLRKRCVNIEHLEAVTQSENVKRAIAVGKATGVGNWNRKTHCKHGHEFTEANTFTNKRTGKRNCRKCIADTQKRARQRDPERFRAYAARNYAKRKAAGKV